MDKRKKYICVLDTETANGILEEDGTLNLDNSLVYDIGYAIVDKKGKVYLTRSLVIADIYIGYKDLMQSAYYANKLPQYEVELKNGTRKLVTLATAKKMLADDMAEWGCDTVSMHNARFDVRALNNTIRYLTKSKQRYFLPYNTEVWDTLSMAQSVIAPRPTYKRFCLANDYMTKNRPPRVRLTAEVLNRYLTHDNSFIESHTGLEDVLIEKDILARCLASHKKMKKVLYGRKC